jgi:hypothetical protein
MNLKTAIAKLLSDVGAILVNTAAQIGAANGGIRSGMFLPGPHHDGRIARRGRRKHCARAVDCVVIDQWLMWRS